MKSHLEAQYVQHINSRKSYSEWNGDDGSRDVHTQTPSHPSQQHLKVKTMEAWCSLPHPLHRSIGCALGGTSGLIPVWIFFLVTSALQLPLTYALHAYRPFPNIYARMPNAKNSHSLSLIASCPWCSEMFFHTELTAISFLLPPQLSIPTPSRNFLRKWVHCIDSLQLSLPL